MAKVALFGSYNARFVDPQTVADTFVLRAKEFAVLCQPANSLVIGPRGSGKTTLLKMLKVSAQVKWSSFRKPLRRLPFTAIYVGAERQFDLLTSSVTESVAHSSLLAILSQALLSTRVKFSCLDTLREISNSAIQNFPVAMPHFVFLSREKEADICGALSRVWGVRDRCYSVAELRSSLYEHIAFVNSVVERMRYGFIADVESVMKDNIFVSHDPIYSCTSFVDVFDSFVSEKPRAWGLCIDELEILPISLQQNLFAAFRSVDQRVVVKLATSPFAHINWDSKLNDGPMPGHDFTPINLAFANKKDSKRFTAQLFDALLNSEGVKRHGTRPAERAEAVLGVSPIQEANTSHLQRRAYAAPDGEHYKRFASLRDRDIAFRQFLFDREIGLEELYDEPEHRRAAVARKYIWQVAVRNEYGPTNVFTRGDASHSRSPSRKRLPDIYLGYDSLITACEGNPRTTIGLMRPLARHFTGANDQVPQELQASILQTTIAKYVSLLSTIPVDDGSDRSVIDILDQVGEYLSSEVNGATFKAEPSLAIRVDRNVPLPIQDAIGSAMNQGAFVMLSDQTGLFDFGSILGARLRLSYLLCPRYHLPLTFGKTINLSTILGQDRQGRTVRRLSMKDLFENIDDADDI